MFEFYSPEVDLTPPTVYQTECEGCIYEDTLRGWVYYGPEEGRPSV